MDTLRGLMECVSTGQQAIRATLHIASNKKRTKIRRILALPQLLLFLRNSVLHKLFLAVLGLEFADERGVPMDS